MVYGGVGREGREGGGGVVQGLGAGGEEGRLGGGRHGHVRQRGAAGVMRRLWGKWSRLQRKRSERRAHRDSATLEGELCLDDPLAQPLGCTGDEGTVEVPREVVDALLVMVGVEIRGPSATEFPTVMMVLVVVVVVAEGGKEVVVFGAAGCEGGVVRGGGKDQSGVVLCSGVEVGVVVEGWRGREEGSAVVARTKLVTAWSKK